MKWSLRIARVAGIGIYLHWTFLLLLAWIAIASPITSRDELAEMLLLLAFIMSLFGCVLLHELGHALTAKRFGISTRDITLLPIGGIARLEKMPEDPWQEFWVAVAGPAVNVAIAAILYAVLTVTGRIPDWTNIDLIHGSFAARLMIVNIGLVVFNMLPAFPMDGGRVLRAVLAMRMSRVKATQIAATVGQAMAVFFGIAGLFSENLILVIIALFVFLGAQGEAQAVALRSMFNNVKVRDVMTTRFEALSSSDTLAQAAQELLAGHQQDFPVLQNDQLIGVLRRDDLFRAVKSADAQQQIAEVMTRHCPAVDAQQPLDQALELMQQHKCNSLPVLQQGQLIGLLTSENVGEWTMLAAIREEGRGRDYGN